MKTTATKSRRYDVTVGPGSIVYTYTDLGPALRFASSIREQTPGKRIQVHNEFGTLLLDTDK